MAEIEDVSQTSGGAVKHILRPLLDGLPVGQQHSGIEIALDGATVSQRGPRLVERDAPIHADNVGAGLAHGGKQGCGISSEVDHWDFFRLQRAD